MQALEMWIQLLGKRWGMISESLSKTKNLRPPWWTQTGRAGPPGILQPMVADGPIDLPPMVLIGVFADESARPSCTKQAGGDSSLEGVATGDPICVLTGC